MWVSLQNEKRQPIVAKIVAWVHFPIKNIYESFIEQEIRHRISLFGERGGDISAFPLEKKKLFTFEELQGNETVGDIIGETSPLLFYCDRCGSVEQYRNSKDVILEKKCSTCGQGTMKQLQFVYSCSCGYAEPIEIKSQNLKDYRYYPNENQYVLHKRKGQLERIVQLNIKCPRCGSTLTVDNASSKRNYKQQSVTVVNLWGDATGKFYEKGNLAFKTVVARWFNKVSQKDYEKLVSNLDYAFRRIEKKSDNAADFFIQQIRKQIQDPEQIKAILEIYAAANSEKGTPQREIDSYAAICDEILEDYIGQIGNDAYSEWLGRLAFKLVQYYRIRDSKALDLDDCISHMKEYEIIDSPCEVLSLHRKLGIKDMMVTNDVELVTCVYGYTRKTDDPTSKNIKGRLKLNSFGRNKEGLLISYGVKLNTEGILFDIDQRRIIEWLNENKIIGESEMPDLDSDESVKRWYLTHIHSENITSFGNINPSDEITNAVFCLLHSMSHAFIREAGEISGLDKNSLAEMIIVETASIFLYAQSEQGLKLGALSSMADLSYTKFLNDTYVNSRNCVFDPICLEAETSCSACQLIPETSCKYFNHNLGRKYLFTYGEHQSGYKIGFWDII